MGTESDRPLKPDLEAENLRLRAGLEALNTRLAAKLRQDRALASHLETLRRDAEAIDRVDAVADCDGELLVPMPARDD